MAEWDVHDIERRLQEYDPRVLRIDLDRKRMKHKVICWDPIQYEEYTAMTVPVGELDARVERRMMEINPERFNAMDDIYKSIDAREKASDQKASDMALDMAETILSSFKHKPSRTIE